jgi:hypothetical protein
MRRFLIQVLGLTAILLMMSGVTMAQVSSLNSGYGLAALYPGDDGIQDDPKVVFFENFEVGNLQQIKDKWGYAKDGGVLSLVEEGPEGSVGSTALQMASTVNKHTGGELYKTFPGSKWEQIYLRFYVKFEKGHGFLHHFVALRGFKNPAKAPSGNAGNKSEDYFSVTLDCYSVNKNYVPAKTYAPPGVWGFYPYWPEMRSWQTEEGVPDGRSSPYYGNFIMPRDPVAIERDRWICLEFMIKLNTAPDVRDGELALWVDGELVYHMAPGTVEGYWIRDQWRNDPDNPKSQPFEGFLWRNDMDVFINVLRLQHYVSEDSFSSTLNYLTKDPTYPLNFRQAIVWFDNIVMATDYIGPIKSK